jgi:hypothetical protein
MDFRFVNTSLKRKQPSDRYRGANGRLDVPFSCKNRARTLLTRCVYVPVTVQRLCGRTGQAFAYLHFRRWASTCVHATLAFVLCASHCFVTIRTQQSVAPVVCPHRQVEAAQRPTQAPQGFRGPSAGALSTSPAQQVAPAPCQRPPFGPLPALAALGSGTAPASAPQAPAAAPAQPHHLPPAPAPPGGQSAPGVRCASWRPASRTNAGCAGAGAAQAAAPAAGPPISLAPQVDQQVSGVRTRTVQCRSSVCRGADVKREVDHSAHSGAHGSAQELGCVGHPTLFWRKAVTCIT